MMVCTDLCLYYQTFKTFALTRSYETHKQCTRCNHIVSKEDCPDIRCYCCNALYRDKFPVSLKTRRVARNRKRKRQGKPISLIIK